MIDFDLLRDKYNCSVSQNNKIIVNDNLVEILEFLKNTPEFNFDMLTSLVAVDLQDRIELIYHLYSTDNNNTVNLSYTTFNSSAPSVVNLYKSAYFDECEIYDMFGVNFAGNEKLKRLLMPETWIGHPMLKSYSLNDERLAWND